MLSVSIDTFSYTCTNVMVTQNLHPKFEMVHGTKHQNWCKKGGVKKMAKECSLFVAVSIAASISKTGLQFR